MKRITALLLSILMVASLALGADAFSAGGRLNGDLDNDGRVTVKDATKIQMAIASLITFSDAENTLADYNHDGKVNILDATKIQKVLAGLDVAPEEPTQTETENITETATETVTAAETESETAIPTETETAAPTEETAPNPEVNPEVKILFTNNRNFSKVYFYFYNSVTGKSAAEWPGKQITTFNTNDFGEKIYYSTVDTSKYDRVIFNNGTSSLQTINVAVNKASSGFFISDSTKKTAMLVGTYAENGADSGKITKTTLKYPSGYKKKIWIWTPSDYKATGEKFRTLYIMDGQNLFDDDHTDPFGGWEVTDAVESMMCNGGRGVIIVGIDNSSGNRDSELTPDLGEPVPDLNEDFSKRTGEQFNDFVVNTVMPYVQKNYNSSKAARDNFIGGSSSGGLEAFYIGMENTDKFSMICSLSPAYLIFDNETWDNYLSKFDFTSEDMPLLYIYNGNVSLETQLYPSVIDMYNYLLNHGWDSSKIKLSIEEKGDHNESWWRMIFPESLTWLLGI